jgi:hypothetical protein
LADFTEAASDKNPHGKYPISSSRVI